VFCRLSYYCCMAMSAHCCSDFAVFVMCAARDSAGLACTDHSILNCHMFGIVQLIQHTQHAYTLTPVSLDVPPLGFHYCSAFCSASCHRLVSLHSPSLRVPCNLLRVPATLHASPPGATANRSECNASNTFGPRRGTNPVRKAEFARSIPVGVKHRRRRRSHLIMRWSAARLFLMDCSLLEPDDADTDERAAGGRRRQGRQGRTRSDSTAVAATLPSAREFRIAFQQAAEASATHAVDYGSLRLTKYRQATNTAAESEGESKGERIGPARTIDGKPERTHSNSDNGPDAVGEAASDTDTTNSFESAASLGLGYGSRAAGAGAGTNERKALAACCIPAPFTQKTKAKGKGSDAERMRHDASRGAESARTTGSRRVAENGARCEDETGQPLLRGGGAFNIFLGHVAALVWPLTPRFAEAVQRLLSRSVLMFARRHSPTLPLLTEALPDVSTDLQEGRTLFCGLECFFLAGAI
jgi:hypothetical protein